MCFHSALVWALTGTLTTMLNDPGDGGCLCLVPNVGGNVPVLVCRPWGCFLG